MGTLTATRKTGSSTGSPFAFYTSGYGCVSDADLSETSTSTNANTTDNTAKLQTLIDQVSSLGGGRIVWDGKYAHSGLVLKSNVHIDVLPGCGSWLRSGSNKPSFRTVRSYAVPLTFNVRISGMRLHGNAGGQDNRGTPQYGLNTGYSLYGVKNLLLENCVTWAPRTYSVHCIGAKNATVRNYVSDYGPVDYENHDGVHFDGYSEDCLAENLVMRCSDDVCCINADDAYRNPGWGLGHCGDFYYRDEEPGGPVKGVTFRKVHIRDGHRCGLRLLSAGSRVTDVVYEDIHGDTAEMGFVCDSYSGVANVSVAGPGNVGKVTFRGWNLKVAKRVPSYSQPANTNFACNIEELILENWTRSLFDDNDYPTFHFYKYPNAAAPIIQNVTIRGYLQRDNGTAFTTPAILNNGAIIGNLTIEGATVERTGATNFSPVFKQVAGSFGKLSMRGITGKNIHNLVEIAGGTAGIVKVVDATHTGSSEFSFFSAVPVPTLVASNVHSSTTLINSATNFASTAGDAFGTTTTAPPPPSGTIASPTSNPKFVDTFSTGTRDSAWALGFFEKPASGSAVQQNGTLSLTPPVGTGGYTAYTEATGTTFAGGIFGAEVVQAPSMVGFNTELSIGTSNTTADRARWVTEDGQLYAQISSSQAGQDYSASIAYDPAAHRWWRIRHRVDTGKLYWDTSADGENWTPRFESATQFNMSSVRGALCATQKTNVTGTATAIFDNVKRY